MKKKAIFLHLAILMLLPALISGQSGNWESVNDGQVNCRNFVSVSGAPFQPFIAIDNNYLYHSDDGAIWQQDTQLLSNNYLYDIECPAANQYVATGHYGIWQSQTGNGGWVQVTAGQAIKDISFAGKDSAFALTTYSSVYWTKDGCSTFINISPNPNIPAAAVCALNGKTAVLASNPTTSAAALYKYSTSSGQWTTVANIPGYQLRALHFPTSQRGFAVGTNGLLLKSYNGGNTWTSATLATGINLVTVHFVDAQVGFIGAATGEVFKTFDGGATWTTSDSGVFALNDIFSSDGSRVVAIGADGRISVSNDGGQTWVYAVTGGFSACGNFRSAFFTDENEGYVCGTNGKFFKTTDSGQHWNQLMLPISSTLYVVFFPSKETGFVTGDEGVIFKTKDKGASWYSVPVNGLTGPIHDLHFAHGEMNTGYAAMAGGGVLKTIDGGETWFQLDSFTTYCLLGVHFATPEMGWVVGALGFIARTTDGGQSWTVQNPNTSSTLEDVFFLNDTLGWAAGDNGILRTVDGGEYWDTVYTSSTQYFNHIHFTDAQNGWAVGESGIIMRTSDGGITWTNDQNMSLTASLWGVHFPTQFTGYIAGSLYTILKSDQGVELNIDSITVAAGSTVMVPVTARNFKNISSLQGTVHLGNPTDFTLVGIKNAALTSIYTYVAPGQARNILWYSPTGCLTLANDAPLFYVEVKSNGQSGACTSIYIDGIPMPLKIYRCDGNSYTSVAVTNNIGAACSVNNVQIAGKITLENGQGITADVSDTQSPSQLVTNTATNAAGGYVFSGLAGGIDHQIQASKNGTGAGCIDVIDIFTLYGIIINGNPFASIGQQIAADLDGNGLVDVQDLFILQDFVGNGTPFPIGKMWRFLPVKNSVVFDATSLSVPNIQEFYQLHNLSGDTSELDFIAIPLGSLFDHDCFTNNPVDARTTIAFSIEKEYRTEDGIVLFHVKCNEWEDIAAIQLMLAFDPAQLEYLDLQPGCLTGWGNGVFPMPKAGNGLLPVLWYHTNDAATCISAKANETLFSLVFRMNENSVSDQHTLGLSDSRLQPKVYNKAGQNVEVRQTLDFATESPRLLQNQPNPFTQQTTISYFLPPGTTQAEIIVTDVLGRIIACIPLASCGEASVQFEEKDAPPGLYFYSLLVNGKVADTKRMTVE